MDREELQRIIYDECIGPTEDDGEGRRVPPYDEAKADGWGGYEMVQRAAERILAKLNPAA